MIKETAVQLEQPSKRQVNFRPAFFRGGEGPVVGVTAAEGEFVDVAYVDTVGERVSEVVAYLSRSSTRSLRDLEGKFALGIEFLCDGEEQLPRNRVGGCIFLAGISQAPSKII